MESNTVAAIVSHFCLECDPVRGSFLVLCCMLLLAHASCIFMQALYSFAAGAAYGGAYYYGEGVDSYITFSTFLNNSAALSGGAVAVQGCDVALLTPDCMLGDQPAFVMALNMLLLCC